MVHASSPRTARHKRWAREKCATPLVTRPWDWKETFAAGYVYLVRQILGVFMLMGSILSSGSGQSCMGCNTISCERPTQNLDPAPFIVSELLNAQFYFANTELLSFQRWTISPAFLTIPLHALSLRA